MNDCVGEAPSHAKEQGKAKWQQVGQDERPVTQPGMQWPKDGGEEEKKTKACERRMGAETLQVILAGILQGRSRRHVFILSSQLPMIYLQSSTGLSHHSS